MSKKQLYPRDGQGDHRNKVSVPCQTPGCKAPAHLPDSFCDYCAAQLAAAETCPLCGRKAQAGELCERCLGIYAPDVRYAS